MSSLSRVAGSTPGQPRIVAVRPAAWASFASACLGWMFDAMDLQLFTLILFPSVIDLVGTSDLSVVAYRGGLILAWKLVAWGIGGIVFGVVADHVGRSKAMILTISIYSIFTGASGLAQNWWQLAALQALAALGIGGEWAAGAALVAETWPERTRARALVGLQMSFAFGFFLAALLNLVIGPMGWRLVLAAGVLPAVVLLFVRQFVPESPRWLAVRVHRDSAVSGSVSATPMATLAAVFAPGMRRRTIVAFVIASTLMIGTFSATALLPIWIPELVGLGNADRARDATSQCFMLINMGAIPGYLVVMWLANVIGRRWAYAVITAGCVLANLLLFMRVETIQDLRLLAPVFGFFAVGGFGTLATYLPELFPTRIRATGQGFCWNAARILTAAGPVTTGMIVSAFGSIRGAGAMITAVYCVGLLAIWFGPETRNTSLQD